MAVSPSNALVVFGATGDHHDSDDVLAKFTKAGIDVIALRTQLLDEGTK
jgi:hypothetical protein